MLKILPTKFLRKKSGKVSFGLNLSIWLAVAILFICVLRFGEDIIKIIRTTFGVGAVTYESKTLIPVDDSYVVSSKASANFGRDRVLKIEASPETLSYLKFDLTSLQNINATDAKLRLRVNGKVGESVSTVEKITENSWQESTLTYSNRPLPSASAPKYNGVFSIQKFVDFDISEMVKTSLGGNLTILVSTVGAKTDFNSKESSYKPKLIVTYVSSQSPTPSPTAAPPTPTPTALLTPTPTPITSSVSGIWIGKEEIAKLPTSGSDWDKLVSDANSSISAPNISDQDATANIKTFAKALVYARVGNSGRDYRGEVRDILKKLVGTECGQVGNVSCPESTGARSLAIGRELPAFVLAADLIDLKNFDADFNNNTFKPWLIKLIRRKNSEGRSVITCQAERPNNWGSVCGASRVAVDLYVGDSVDLNTAVKVFRGYLGDRSLYAGFTYGDLSWQCDSSKPVGINPKGCTKDGHSLDGVIADDQRRCGGYSWPPCKTDYPWEADAGNITMAEMLTRAGFTAYEWSDRAIFRSVNWLYNTTFSDGTNQKAVGDDAWIAWIVNKRYGTAFARTSPTSVGGVMAYSEWTHR